MAAKLANTPSGCRSDIKQPLAEIHGIEIVGVQSLRQLPLGGDGSGIKGLRRAAMSDKAESAATRLWRDRAQLREQERNEAQTRARIAEEKVAILAVENHRLATEIARLRALLTPDAARARAET